MKFNPDCVATRLIIWLVLLVVCPFPVNLWAASFQEDVLDRTIAGSPAWGCEERPCVEVDLSDRVLAYLEREEKHERNPSLRDDYRIAWITTQWSQHGVPEWSLHGDASPYVAATFQVLHCHPSEVWPNIVAQRKAKLGAEYSTMYDENDLLRKEDLLAGLSLSPPKKPAQSERQTAREKFAA